jgi:hypothetical protein
MNKNEKQSFPRWAFAMLAVGGLLASGIFIGIMSVEGYTNVRLVEAVGFGIMGLLMFWGAYSGR